MKKLLTFRTISLVKDVFMIPNAYGYPFAGTEC